MSQQFLEELCRHLNYEIDPADAIRFIPDGKGDFATQLSDQRISSIISMQFYTRQSTESDIKINSKLISRISR